MKFFRQKEQPPEITRPDALACIPQRSSSIDWNELENGDIFIEYKLDIKPFFISIVRKFSKQPDRKITKKLQLDEMGSSVWRMIDGQNDVKFIIKIVSEKSGLSLQEAEISVTTFLRDLGRRGLIRLQ